MNADDFLCAVCLDICKTPVECLNCGNIFCRLCLVLVHKCPLGRASPMATQISAFAKRIIDNLNIVKCPFFYYPVNCKWENWKDLGK